MTTLNEKLATQCGQPGARRLACRIALGSRLRALNTSLELLCMQRQERAQAEA
jgi:hypothetical protein